MGPKSVFDPEDAILPDESAIIQAPSDLLSLLLPLLAIIMSHFRCRSSNRLDPKYRLDSSGLGFVSMLEEYLCV